jgi:hypothetical protein
MGLPVLRGYQRPFLAIAPSWRDSQQVALVAAPFDRVGVGLLSYAQLSFTGHAR